MNNLERHRSGHNGADSKFVGLVSFSSDENPVFMRGHAVRKTEYFAVLSVSSFQKFFLCKKHQENGGLTYTEAYRSGHNGPDSKSCYFLQKLNIYYTEAYRSGHNELHSKCSSPQGLVGSNPTASAKNNPA